MGSLIRTLESDRARVECFRADGGCCVAAPGCRLRVMVRAAKERFYQSLDEHALADCLDSGRIASPLGRRKSRAPAVRSKR